MKKSDITVAVSIAVLVIVGVGIYYAVSKNNPNVTSNIPASTTQSPTTPTPTVPVANTPTPAPSSVTVSIKNFSFNPSTLTIKTGTKVTWVNNDSVPHTVTSDSGSLLNSPTLSPGQSFSFTFISSGTINYHCNIHLMMKGSVVVQK